MSVAQRIAEVAPSGAQVLKAFNTVFRGVLENGRPGVFFAGDDAGAVDAGAFRPWLNARAARPAPLLILALRGPPFAGRGGAMIAT